MMPSPCTARNLSRLMLGTVQFGMPYGIANRSGQPAYREVVDILACAYEGGVNCLDTAASYGESEAVLGAALAELGLAEKMTVITKVEPIPKTDCSQAEADAHIENSVVRSLKRLRLESLPVCLLHREENLRYWESLLRLKERGLVRYIGCSMATPEVTAALLAADTAEAIQVPTNLLDYRFRDANVFRTAETRGVAVFVRSVYLQGLLLLPEAQVPPELSEVLPARRALEQQAQQAGMSLAELAARYVLSLPGVTSVLVGVETLAQMRQNLLLFSKGPLETTLKNAVEDSIPRLPETLLAPPLWPKAVLERKNLSNERT